MRRRWRHGLKLFGRGLEAGYPPELWCVERPEEVLWLHGEFLKAGADLILTNSFGAMLQGSSYIKPGSRSRDQQSSSRACARSCMPIRRILGYEGIVAGSMGPTGELFAPMGDLL